MSESQHAGANSAMEQLMSQLTARHRELEAQLRGTVDADARAALKADIIALFRETEAALAALITFRDDVRALATQWKEANRAATPTPAVTRRVDHLGASTFVEKGWSRLSISDAAGAEEALRRALELAPDQIEASTLLAWSLVQQDRLVEARVVSVQVLQQDAHNALARTVAGLLALREGKVTEAIDMLGRAITNAEYDRRAALYARLYLGVALRTAGHHGDAITTLQRALELGPNLLEAAYELGCTQREAGNEPAALETWRQAASANKFSPWGKRCAEMIALSEGGEAPVAARS